VVKPLVADTGGLLRALARGADGRPSWPDYQDALVAASAVIVPALILPEVDYFLREERAAMKRLVAEILDPRTRYELELPSPADLARAIEIDARFANLGLGLVDGTVAAVAERRQVLRVLTIDRKHFSALRVGPRLDRALELVP
jgi:predicted nucleic acid-binding protein